MAWSAPVEPPTDADHATAASYTAQFLSDIEHVDRYQRPLLDAWALATYVACTVIVDEIFDQTPAPSAGTATRGFR